MASLGDILSFEKFNLKEMFNKIKDDPERIFLGAIDPIGSKLWGGITGKDYEPAVNYLGGPTDETFARARASGINTNGAETAHEIAGAIASMFGAKGAGSALGKLAGSGASAAGNTTSGAGSKIPWGQAMQGVGNALMSAQPQQYPSNVAPPPPPLIAPGGVVGNPALMAQLQAMLARVPQPRPQPVAPQMTRGEALTQGGASVGQALTQGY